MYNNWFWVEGEAPSPSTCQFLWCEYAHPVVQLLLAHKIPEDLTLGFQELVKAGFSSPLLEGNDKLRRWFYHVSPRWKHFVESINCIVRTCVQGIFFKQYTHSFCHKQSRKIFVPRGTNKGLYPGFIKNSYKLIIILKKTNFLKRGESLEQALLKKKK